MIIFKLFMAIQTFLYRLTGGKLGGKFMGFDVLLLTTTGRKSGRTRTVPLGNFSHSGGYVVVASNGGQPSHPAWYFNLKSNPHVTIQVLDKVIPAIAEVLTGDERAQAWQQVIATAPNYAAYQKKTSREIPLVLLRPNGKSKGS